MRARLALALLSRSISFCFGAWLAAKLFPDAQVWHVFFCRRAKVAKNFCFLALFSLTLEFQVQPYLKHLANQLACATLAS
jgi:hypothetical protein